MIKRSLAAASAIVLAAVHVCDAQQRITRAEVVASAVRRAPSVAISAADAAVARAELARARELENPVLGVAYSRDTPQDHVTLDVPLSFLWTRAPRIAVASASLNAASIRLSLQQQQAAYDADTAYTNALSATTRAFLSQKNARDADSLVVLARLRRDAGDGTDLEVELAALNAGQMTNVAALDSLDRAITLIRLQTFAGIDSSSSIVLADSLELPASPVNVPFVGAPMLAAASEELRAAELGIALERRQRFVAPSLSIGFETRDPGGLGNQLLPTIGVALPLPLFNQNRGAIMAATAQRDRALAQLEQMRREVDISIRNARAAFIVSQERARRSALLVERANRVAALSLLGYREGATALSVVLEAQRSIREAQLQYVLDVASAQNESSLLLFLQHRMTIPTETDRNRR